MANVPVYAEGDTRNLKGNFKNSASVDTDPAGVTFKMKKPNGTVVTFIFNTDAELVKDSTGNYHVEVTFDQSGDWYYYFEGTGATGKGKPRERLIRIEDSRITD